MAPGGVAGDLYESITGQLFELGRQLRQRNGYPFDPAMLKRHLQDAIEGNFVGIRSDPRPISVDYGMSVDELVQLGHYNRVDKDVCSVNFRTEERNGMVEVVMEIIRFCYPLDATTGDVLQGLHWAGYRPAELHELLAFGVKYPDIQREFPVVALGSVCSTDVYNGTIDAPYLYGNDSERCLGLIQVGCRCDESWRFAAVRK